MQCTKQDLVPFLTGMPCMSGKHTSAVSHKISEEAFSWALSVPLNQSLLIAGDNEEASEEQGLWTYL